MTKKVSLHITSLAPGGDGVSIEDGHFCYVPGAVPGDEVEVEILKRNKRETFTRLLRILEQSRFRRTPPCPVFSKCGGCSLLHMDESVQIDAKQASLMRQFARDSVALISAGPSLGYRRLARLHARKTKRGHVQLGFYENRAHRIVDISHCPILAPDISQILPALKSGILKGIEQATIRIATGDEGVYVHVQTNEPPEPVFYKEADKAVPSLLKGVVLDWDGMISTVAGASNLTVTSGDGVTPLQLPVGSFGQANPYINQELVSTVANWVKQSDARQLLELYAGAGNFSFELRNHLDAITMVELDAKACDVAKMNFKAVTNATVVCDDALSAYKKIGTNAPLILLDPPRTGAQDLMREMARHQHQTVIYVSCNTATLKRDLAYLQQAGYVLWELKGFDMFPQTAHLEAAARLEKV